MHFLQLPFSVHTTPARDLITTTPATIDEPPPARPHPLSLLALGTSFLVSDDPLRNIAQNNTLETLRWLYPDVIGVCFVDSEFATRASDRNIDAITSFETNDFGVPIFPRIMKQLKQGYKTTPFIGYQNGDILFNTNLKTTLLAILHFQKENLLKQKLLLIGRRWSVHLHQLDRSRIVQPSHNSVDDFASQIEEILNSDEAKIDPPFALDYFIYSRNTMDWDMMPDYVIGRNQIDSALSHYAYLNPSIDVVAIHGSVKVIHQKGKCDTSYCFHNTRVEEDSDWNVKLAAREFKQGHWYKHGVGTSDSNYYTHKDENVIQLRRRESDNVVGIYKLTQSISNLNP